jgi:hypothetical protein
MSQTFDLSKELFLEINDSDKFDNACIHITELLKNQYGDVNNNALVRGKLYHYALETLLQRLEKKGVLKIDELETTHIVTYPTKYKTYRLCFTPDVIFQKDNNTILLEIKSTSKSLNYAFLQTSIYKYLLETFFNKKIDECGMLTGDLMYYRLSCDHDLGKQELEKRLTNSLLLFF